MRMGPGQTMSMWCGMLGWRVWLPGLMGTMISSSQAGCSTLAMYRHSPLYAADHSGSATGTAYAATPSRQHPWLTPLSLHKRGHVGH